MGAINWSQCLSALEAELPEHDFNTWVRPLHAVESPQSLRLLAPNRFVVDWVKTNLLPRILRLLSHQVATGIPEIHVEVGSRDSPVPSAVPTSVVPVPRPHASRMEVGTRLQPQFKFAWFIDSKSSQLARSAAEAVAENAGHGYNPLFLYGGVGLGKTHLMQAIAHRVRERDPEARIAYVHSERFVGGMVHALQHNAMDDFKEAYRSLDLLLIDDIQFFAGKQRSQEEFVHTFNELLDGQHQIVLACDRYPKEVEGLEERLKSRFGWGLPVAIEAPDVETCVAILISKAQQAQVALPRDVAVFMSQHIRSNVRELEGALRRVLATSKFTGQTITLDSAKDALKDLLSLYSRLISLDRIQKTVAEYFKVRLNELISQRRTRSIARPRQMAMALAKELTSHSLPEIGVAFGGRDHTTVLHACKRIEALRSSEQRLSQDYSNLLRALST